MVDRATAQDPAPEPGFFISAPRTSMARKQRSRKRSDNSAKSSKRGRKSASARKPVASDQAAIRATTGQFQKGKSGNPGGRPKENAEVKELARAHTTAAIERLAYWMASSEPKASVAAALALLDRAWGKPTQPVSGEDGKPIDINLGEVRGAIAGKLSRIAANIAA